MDKAGTIRQRLEQAIAGEVITHPVFVVYDWFVRNRAIDWDKLFELGLGQINHVDLIQYHRPHVEVTETVQTVNGQKRRDVCWVTDIGELHEWYLGEWRQEYLIKRPEDYHIMLRAWMDTQIVATDESFNTSEEALGNRGITIGQMDRTPFQKIQIDYAGLERFSYDIADRNPYLLELLELMNALKLEEFKCIRQSQASHLKLWENLSIETMGPHLYRQYLVPMYRQIFQILDGSGKRLHVHYDGKLSIIAKDIQDLPFDGLDSLTPPPEGDMTIAQARTWWPDKFLWLHPSLTWYRLSQEELVSRIRSMVRDAGPTRYCLMIGEEVPHNWEVTVPLILDTLSRSS